MKLQVTGISGNPVLINVSDVTVGEVCSAIGVLFGVSPFDVVLIQSNSIVSGDMPLHPKQHIYYHLLESKHVDTEARNTPCDKICRMLSTMQNPGSAEKRLYTEYAAKASQKPRRYRECIQRLSQLGYDLEAIEEALRYTNFDVEQAADLLSDNEERLRFEEAFLSGRRYRAGLDRILHRVRMEGRADVVPDDVQQRVLQRLQERAQQRMRRVRPHPEDGEHGEDGNRLGGRRVRPVPVPDQSPIGNAFDGYDQLPPRIRRERMEQSQRVLERTLATVMEQENDAATQRTIMRILDEIESLRTRIAELPDD